MAVTEMQLRLSVTCYERQRVNSDPERVNCDLSDLSDSVLPASGSSHLDILDHGSKNYASICFIVFLHHRVSSYSVRV